MFQKEETVDYKKYNYMDFDSTFIIYRRIFIQFCKKNILFGPSQIFWPQSKLIITNVNCRVNINTNWLGRRSCVRHDMARPV